MRSRREVGVIRSRKIPESKLIIRNIEYGRPAMSEKNYFILKQIMCYSVHLLRFDEMLHEKTICKQ